MIIGKFHKIRWAAKIRLYFLIFSVLLIYFCAVVELLSARPFSFTFMTAAVVPNILFLICSYFYGRKGFLFSIPAMVAELLHETASFNTTGSDCWKTCVFYESGIVISAAIIAFVVEMERKNFVKVKLLSITDGLTGLYDYRFFQERLNHEVENASKNGESVSLCIIDIDHFKEINDAFGHNEGDCVLKKMGELILSTIRESDIACRYGGDEFAVIFPHTDQQGMIFVIERIIHHCEQFTSNTNPKVTVSIGCSSYPTLAFDSKELFKQADIALYDAKRMGRNTYMLYHGAESYKRESVIINRQAEGKNDAGKTGMRY